MQEYDTLLNYQKLYKLSTRNIMEAAVKGVIMLQETYNQKIQDYSSGDLSLTKCVVITMSSDINKYSLI